MWPFRRKHTWFKDHTVGDVFDPWIRVIPSDPVPEASSSPQDVSSPTWIYLSQISSVSDYPEPAQAFLGGGGESGGAGTSGDWDDGGMDMPSDSSSRDSE